MTPPMEAPTRKPVGGEITLNGDVYVPLSEYEQMERRAADLRRTLGVAHMHLSFSENSQALVHIQKDTGLTVTDARAMRSVLMGIFGSNG